MAGSRNDALLAADLCNVLLAKIDRLETIVRELIDSADDRVRIPRRASIHKWIGDARETVLEIKSRL